MTFKSIIFAATTLTLSTGANAAFIAASDGFGGFKNLFTVDEDVFAFGDMNKIADPGPFGTLLNPVARVYVMPNQEWNGGETLTDVTNNGFDVVTGVYGSGYFADVPIWTDNLVVGTYDIILDENNNGRFDPINDTVMDIFNAGEFIITDPNAPPAVPVPAAVWLFASGLTGIIGLARRKAS